MEKKLLPHEEMVRVLELLQSQQYTDSYETSMDGYHQEFIRVYDDTTGVQVVAFYDSDDCKHSVEMPEITYTYEVGGHKILVDQDDEGIYLTLESEEFELNEEDEAYAEIMEFFCDELGKYYDYYSAYEKVRWAEWTEDELYEEILDGLECDEYILTEEGYVGVDEEDEEWMDEDELEKYRTAKRYTPEEVARALAQQGCPDASC